MKLRFLVYFLLIGCIVYPLFFRRSTPVLNNCWKKSDAIHVLCTTGMIADLVQEIGQEDVEAIILIRKELDPHSYQLVKGDAEKFSSANIIFYHGLALEHGASLLKILQTNTEAISIGKDVQKRVPNKLLMEKGAIDPHIWMDVSLWKYATHIIEETLCSYQKDKAQEFHLRAEALREKMQCLHDKLLGQMQEIPLNKRYVITSHDAFSYFARAYLCDNETFAQRCTCTDSCCNKKEWKMSFQAPAGLAPEGNLRYQDIERIVLHAKKFGIETIFSESNVGQDSLQKIVQCARAKGMKMQIAKEPLYGDSMGPHGYFGMMEHNVRVLRKYLQ